jgi:hypothetical protein
VTGTFCVGVKVRGALTVTWPEYDPGVKPVGDAITLNILPVVVLGASTATDSQVRFGGVKVVAAAVIMPVNNTVRVWGAGARPPNTEVKVSDGGEI